MPAPPNAQRSSSPSIWSPLQIRLFRAVWLAGLASNVGSWMHLVAAQWEMTTLTGSAALVGLISTAGALPAFVLAVPAGALADIVDRRRLIVISQAWQLVVAAVLGVLTVTHITDPAILIAATAVLGFGASLGLPAFSAVTPELVEQDQLPSAIALNSVSMTLSQAIGPAIGGLLVAAIGSGGVFLLNATSFVGVLVVIVAWRRAPDVHRLPPEHLTGAMRAGVRYLVNAPELRGVLIRVGVYVFGYSAAPSLLAVLARKRLAVDATGFGLLLGCVGAGGVLGATLLPGLRARFGTDRLATCCMLVVAVALGGLAAVSSLPLALAVMTVLGFVSIGVISSLTIAVQAVLPAWVRGRGLAMLALVFQAGFAGGAAVWGAIATATTIGIALAVAAVYVALGSLLGLRFRLAAIEGLDVSLATGAEPYPPVSLAADDGPVQLSVEYRIAAVDIVAFRRRTDDLARARRRAGATHWTLYADIRDDERQLEVFTVASWSEHLRQAERETAADRATFDDVAALHIGADAPRQRAMLAESTRRRRTRTTSEPLMKGVDR